MNLHRVHAKEKYLQRYTYLLRHQIVQFLAIQPRSLQRLERAVGRSGRLHPSFMSLLEELTTYKSQKSKEKLLASSVPSIRVGPGHGGGGMTGMGYYVGGGGGDRASSSSSSSGVASSLLRLKKESWKYFDAFGISDRLIASLIPAMKRDQVSAVTPADMQVAEDEALRYPHASLLFPSRDDSSAKGSPYMSPEFFLMQDLLIDALVSGDAHNTLFLLLLQLLHAKNLGPVFSRIKSTSSRKHVDSLSSTSTKNGLAPSRDTGIHAASSSSVSPPPLPLPANDSSSSSSSSSSSRGGDRRMESEEPQSDRLTSSQEANTEDSTSHAVASSSSSKTDKEEEQEKEREDAKNSSDESSSISTSGYLHEPVCSALKLLDALVQSPGLLPCLLSSGPVRKERGDGEEEGDSFEEDRRSDFDEWMRRRERNEEGVDEERCGVVPGRFLRPLKAAIEELRDHKDTFAEVKRYCEVLLSRIEKNTKKSKRGETISQGEGTSRENEMAGKPAQEREEDAMPLGVSGIAREGQRRSREAVEEQVPRVEGGHHGSLYERGEKEDEKKHKSSDGFASGSVVSSSHRPTAAGDDDSQKSRGEEEKRDEGGDAEKEEQRGDGEKDASVKTNEGALRQRQMLLALQQRQRDFSSFLEEADMLSDSSSNKSDEDEKKKRREESRRDSRQEREGGDVEGSSAGQGISTEREGVKISGTSFSGESRREEGLMSSSTDSGFSSSSSSSSSVRPGVRSPGTPQVQNSSMERELPSHRGEREEEREDKDTSKTSSSKSPSLTLPSESRHVSSSSLRTSSSPSYLVPPCSSSSAVVRRRAASRMMVSYVLTAEEKEMRCGICLEGYSVANPLALLGHISQLNLLRRLCSTGKANFPASHPMFSSCGHLAHIHCIRSLQEKPGSASTNTRRPRGRGGRPRLEEGGGGSGRRRASQSGDETLTIEQTALEAVAASANLRTQTDRLLSLIFGEESRGRRSRRRNVSAELSSGGSGADGGVLGGRRRRRGEGRRREREEEDEDLIDEEGRRGGEAEEEDDGGGREGGRRRERRRRRRSRRTSSRRMFPGGELEERAELRQRRGEVFACPTCRRLGNCYLTYIPRSTLTVDGKVKVWKNEEEGEKALITPYLEKTGGGGWKGNHAEEARSSVEGHFQEPNEERKNSKEEADTLGETGEQEERDQSFTERRKKKRSRPGDSKTNSLQEEEEGETSSVEEMPSETPGSLKERNTTNHEQEGGGCQERRKEDSSKGEKEDRLVSSPFSSKKRCCDGLCCSSSPDSLWGCCCSLSDEHETSLFAIAPRKGDEGRRDIPPGERSKSSGQSPASSLSCSEDSREQISISLPPTTEARIHQGRETEEEEEEEKKKGDTKRLKHACPSSLSDTRREEKEENARHGDRSADQGASEQLAAGETREKAMENGAADVKSSSKLRLGGENRGDNQRLSRKPFPFVSSSGVNDNNIEAGEGRRKKTADDEDEDRSRFAWYGVWRPSVGALVGRKRRRRRARERSQSRPSRKTPSEKKSSARSGGSHDDAQASHQGSSFCPSSSQRTDMQQNQGEDAKCMSFLPPSTSQTTRSSSEEDDDEVSDVHLLDDEDYTSSDYCITEGECLDTEVEEANEDCLFFRPEIPPGSILTSPQGGGGSVTSGSRDLRTADPLEVFLRGVVRGEDHHRRSISAVISVTSSPAHTMVTNSIARALNPPQTPVNLSTAASSSSSPPPPARQSPSALALFRGLHSTRLNSGGNADRAAAASSSSFSSSAFPQDRSPRNTNADGPRRSFSFSTFLSTPPSSLFHGTEQRRQYLRDQLEQSAQSSSSSSDAAGMRRRDLEGSESPRRTRGGRRGEKRIEEKARRVCDECEIRHRIFRVQISKGDMKTQRKQFRYQDAVDKLLSRRKNGGPFNLNFLLDNWRCFNRLGSVRWLSRPDKIRVFPEASIGGYTGSNRSASASLYASLQGSSSRRNTGELHSLGFWPCPSSTFSHASLFSSSSSPVRHEFFNHHTLVCSPSSSSDTTSVNSLSAWSGCYPSLLNEEGSTRELGGPIATPRERNEGSEMKSTRSRSRCKDCGGIKKVMESDGVLSLEREKAGDFEEGEGLDEVCMCWTDAELRAWRGANAGMFMEVFEWCTYSSLLIHSHIGSRLEDPFRSTTGVGGRHQEGGEGGEQEEEDEEEFLQEKTPWVQLVRNSFILDALPARCSLWLGDITKVGYWSAGNRFPRSWLELRTSPLTLDQVREEQEEREKSVLTRRLLRGALSKREDRQRRKMKTKQQEGVDSSSSCSSLRREGGGTVGRGRRQEEEEETTEKEGGMTSNSSVLKELSPSPSSPYRTPREERSNIEEVDLGGQSTHGEKGDVQAEQERGVEEAASKTSPEVKKKMTDASSSPRKDRRKNKKKKEHREKRTFDDADDDADDEIISSRNLEEWNWLPPTPPHSCSSSSFLPLSALSAPCSHKSITTPNHTKKPVLDEDEEELCSISAVSESNSIHSIARSLVHSASATTELSSASSFSSLSDSFSPLSSPTSSEFLDVDEEMNEETSCHLDVEEQRTPLSQPSSKEKAEDASVSSARTTIGSSSSSTSSLREQEGKQSSSEERKDEGLVLAVSSSAEDDAKHRCAAVIDASSVSPSHRQENSGQHGLLWLSAEEDRDERRERESRRKERRKEGKKRERRSEEPMVTRDEERNRRRLRKIQREEDLYVWQHKGRRGLSLFSPWSCDVKLEFFKAFISRVLQTPHAIRRRLSELMCIRSLQILEEFLVDECGACFSSSFPSCPTSSTSPVCANNSALTSSSWAMNPSSSPPPSSAFPSLSHPSHRKAFSLFYQDWLRPWEFSGDLPRDLHKSLNWYGFPQAFLHCLQSEGRSLRWHAHTLQDKLSSSQAVSFLPRIPCMRSKEGEEEETRTKTDLIRKIYTEAADSSSSSSLLYLNSLPPSSSSSSSLWREENSKTSLGMSFLEPGFSLQKKSDAILPPLFFSRCDESSCRQEGVKWLYSACKDILLVNSRRKNSSASSSSSRFTSPGDLTRADRRRCLSSSEREGERLSLPHTHGDEGEEEDNDDEYNYDSPSGFTPSREERSPGFHSTPEHEHEQEKKKEMYWTPCFGAAGIAYSKGDRLHRLEKVLNDMGTLTAFWRVLAGKLPQKPSLLQLLQYTCMYWKWGDALEKEKKAREKRRQSQTGGSPSDDRVKELERSSSTGRKEEEVEMDVEEKDEVSEEEKEGKRCRRDREKQPESDDEDDRRMLREKIFTDFEQLLVWLSRERAVSLPQLFQSVVWYLMHYPFFFSYTLTREEQEEETHTERGKGERCDKEREEKMKKEDDDDAKEHEKKTLRKEEREAAMEKDRQEKRESLGEDSYTIPVACPKNPSQQGEMSVEEDGDATGRKKRGEDQKVYDAFISSSIESLSWRTAKKKSGERDAPTTVVPEQEIRVYVQQLWNRFEDRLIIGLCSFLRFSLYLVSAVWTFDTRLLQQLRKTRTAGRAQLQVLLKLFGLPLHFESQVFGLHSEEVHEAGKRRGGGEEEEERLSSSSVLPLRQATGEHRRREGEQQQQEEGKKRRRMKGKDSFFEDTVTFLPSQAFRSHNQNSHKSPSSSSSPSCSHRKRRDVLLSTICRIMFGSPAVVCGALESSRRRVEMSPPCTDEIQALQLHLPLDFLDLLRQTLLRKCPQCGELPEHKAICLLCGGTVCLGSSCCKEEDETRKKKKEATSLRTSRASPGGGGVWGECMMHAQTCGGGCGVFFVVQQSMLFAIDGASWFPLESLYIEDDRHDEKGEGNLSRSRRGGGLGRLVLNQICAKRLAWLLMNGQLLPFVSRSYIRAFALSDAMSLRWP